MPTITIETAAENLNRTPAEVEAAIVQLGYISAGVVGPDLWAMLVERFGTEPEAEQTEQTEQTDEPESRVVTFSNDPVVKSKMVVRDEVKAINVQ